MNVDEQTLLNIATKEDVREIKEMLKISISAHDKRIDVLEKQERPSDKCLGYFKKEFDIWHVVAHEKIKGKNKDFWTWFVRFLYTLVGLTVIVKSFIPDFATFLEKINL